MFQIDLADPADPQVLAVEVADDHAGYGLFPTRARAIDALIDDLHTEVRRRSIQEQHARRGMDLATAQIRRWRRERDQTQDRAHQPA